jgi:hypothetical protein
MKGMVFASRFTPGLKNAGGVRLNRGNRITYELRGGEAVTGAVDCDNLMRHEAGAYGYEVRFDDTGERGFADEQRIVDWEGKPDGIEP